MSHIHISKEEIERIKSLKAVNGKNGDYGKCYFLNKKTLFKLFYPPGCEEELHFVGRKSDYISFPINTYYDDKMNIVGYTIKYFPGRNLWFGFRPNDEIEKLKSAYFKAIDVIKKHPDVLMKDLICYNMMYDSTTNAFYLIDTDKWIVGEDTYFTNAYKFDKQIMFIFTTLFLRWRDYSLNEIKSLRDIYKEYVYDVKRLGIFPDFLTEVSKLVSERKEEEVKTIGDLRI